MLSCLSGTVVLPRDALVQKIVVLVRTICENNLKTRCPSCELTSQATGPAALAVIPPYEKTTERTHHRASKHPPLALHDRAPHSDPHSERPHGGSASSRVSHQAQTSGHAFGARHRKKKKTGGSPAVTRTPIAPVPSNKALLGSSARATPQDAVHPERLPSIGRALRPTARDRTARVRFGLGCATRR